MNECILFEEICLGMFSSLNDFISGYDYVVVMIQLMERPRINYGWIPDEVRERQLCISFILIPVSTEVYFYLKCQPMSRHVPMRRVL